MIPKKASSFYKIVAEDLNTQETLVQDVIEYYYKELRTCLSDLKYLRVYVQGLGQFVIKPVTVENAIERYNKSLINHDTSTFHAYYNKKGIEDKLEKLNALHVLLDLEKQKKETFIKDKNESSTKSNLGE